jgi:hypothetical protein
MWIEVLHLTLFIKHHLSNKARQHFNQTAQAKLKKFLFPLFFALWTFNKVAKVRVLHLIARKTALDYEPSHQFTSNIVQSMHLDS